MWLFRRKKPSKIKRAMERLVTGLIIGTAISYTIGKKLAENEEEDLDEAEEAEDDTL